MQNSEVSLRVRDPLHLVNELLRCGLAGIGKDDRIVIDAVLTYNFTFIREVKNHDLEDSHKRYKQRVLRAKNNRYNIKADGVLSNARKVSVISEREGDLLISVVVPGIVIII